MKIQSVFLKEWRNESHKCFFEVRSLPLQEDNPVPGGAIVRGRPQWPSGPVLSPAQSDHDDVTSGWANLNLSPEIWSLVQKQSFADV